MKSVASDRARFRARRNPEIQCWFETAKKIDAAGYGANSELWLQHFAAWKKLTARGNR